MADKKKETMTLYHYTSKKDARKIKESGYIKKSTDTQNDATYGPGTYLTSLGPEKSRSEIARNNYDGSNNRLADQKMKEGKTEVAIAVDVPKSQFVKVDSDRNVYKTEDNVTITDKNPRFFVRDESGKAKEYKPKK
ncbi:uncharacterized protein LOC110441257 [Mizuhopecten yessoensis]|uniref:uncharacterized protein LOC110441257 n=1 Tax=Mizuhopecten yessoensis TaxID=6573 RepID=UPI000B45C384|nr:uncharacterized protein LOC110441257 [Mizuhopecten yessoensis]